MCHVQWHTNTISSIWARFQRAVRRQKKKIRTLSTFGLCVQQISTFVITSTCRSVHPVTCSASQLLHRTGFISCIEEWSSTKLNQAEGKMCRYYKFLVKVSTKASKWTWSGSRTFLASFATVPFLDTVALKFRSIHIFVRCRDARHGIHKTTKTIPGHAVA
jgi:hypothetical protein